SICFHAIYLEPIPATIRAMRSATRILPPKRRCCRSAVSRLSAHLLQMSPVVATPKCGTKFIRLLPSWRRWRNPPGSNRDLSGDCSNRSFKNRKGEIMSVRVAIIGAGVMGADHARIFAERLPGAELRVICDADETRARRLADALGAAHVMTDRE